MTKPSTTSAPSLFQLLRLFAGAIAMLAFWMGVTSLVGNLIEGTYDSHAKRFVEKKVGCVDARKRYWLEQEENGIEESEAKHDELELLAWRSCFKDYGIERLFVFYKDK